MQDIITPVDRNLIKAELTNDKFLRKTNKGGNEIYITTAKQSPNIMLEIARLREWAFRDSGGGSGKSYDMDDYDFMHNPYKQLFVWDPENEEIIGGYRYICGKDVVLNENGQPKLSTSEMYRFSDYFLQTYLQDTMELGRSFVHPDYQSSKMGSKSLFALDNLWDGLGALTVSIDIKYLFGKVTVYQRYHADARDLLFGFLRKFFPDNEKLVTPIDEFKIKYSESEIDAIFTAETYKENYLILNKEIRNMGTDIPPLVKAYMGLSPNMQTFGYAVYHEFGELIECAIMIPLHQIYEEKKKRHIETFLNKK